MTTPPSDVVRMPTDHLARAAAAVALAAVAVIHILDLPDTLQETPLIGYGYFLLIGAVLAAALVLITVPGPRAWGVADLVAFAAAVAYVLSRTTGVPTDSLDIGNWSCSLGTAALSAEAIVVLLAGWRMQARRPLREFAEGPPAGGTEHVVTHQDGRYVLRESSR